MLLAFGLRVYRLGASSLWNDEGTSVTVAQRDLGTIARDAAHDIHPPLYYWLLHGWLRLAGTSEAGVRFLSALLGVTLVALIYALGRLLAGQRAGLVAALLAAISPFQVYYSQEARMYMLLAVLVATMFYAALRWAAAGMDRGWRPRWVWANLYILATAAGLYTHYAFPMVLAAANLAVLLDIAIRWRTAAGGQRLVRWLSTQLVVGVLFYPWLPTAYQQLTIWPRVAQPLDARLALAETWHVLWSGPASHSESTSTWLWMIIALVVMALPLRRPPVEGTGRRLPAVVAHLAPLLWLCLPIIAMLLLALFKESYLKFLLIVSPAWCLALARPLVSAPLFSSRKPETETAKRIGEAVLLIILTLPCLGGLIDYYTLASNIRDDYRGMAAYIEAIERPGDAIVLDAPGQQEVFGYYYGGSSPVYPLPADRPADQFATEAALHELTAPSGRVFAVLWATDESDPQRIVENWLEQHAYKAIDSWYGNVRLAVYAVPWAGGPQPVQDMSVVLRGAATGDEIALTGVSQWPTALAAGDITQYTLYWQPLWTPSRPYKVFVHILACDNNIVGQTDTEPAGSTRPTTQWAPGETVTGTYGVLVHPATPPGVYRVEVGLYDMDTGERLLAPDGAGQVWLDPLTLERPRAPAPEAALGMQIADGALMGDLALLGYDLHKLGLAHQPDAPLRPGDVLHIGLYWQAQARPAGDWRLAIDLVSTDGREATGIDAEPVPGYATSQWQPGDVWRGQLNLALPGDLLPGRYRLRVQAIPPQGEAPEPFMTATLVVQD